MAGTVLMVGTRKGMWLGRSDEARTDWEWSGPHFEMQGVYSAMVDRNEGSFTAPLGEVLEPRGTIAGVTHAVKTDGKQTFAGSSAIMPPILEPVDLEAFLPESVLNVVTRRVQE